jgi:hypothetical protein
VWATTLEAGSGTVEWRGERLRDSTAPPGVYIARVTWATSGTMTRRFVWLGPSGIRR